MNSYSVYGLIDPRTSAIRYVGCTRSSLEARLAGHIYRPSSSSPVHVWARELAVLGRKPLICLLASAPHARRAGALEQVWILTLRESGALLNDETSPEYVDRGQGLAKWADELPLLARRSAS